MLDVVSILVGVQSIYWRLPLHQTNHMMSFFLAKYKVHNVHSHHLAIGVANGYQIQSCALSMIDLCFGCCESLKTGLELNVHLY